MPRRKMTEEEKKERREAKKYKEEVERIAKTLQNERERFILYSREDKFPTPPPSRVYKVGDRVEMGSIDWVHVLEVLEDGQVYKLLRINSEYPYGKYSGESFKITYQRWTELLPYREPDERSAPPRLEEDEDIQFQYSQRHLNGLLWTYYSSGIDLEPEYQRGNVWTPEQKYNLIDSIFKNIDIGKFTVIRRSFKERLTHYYEMLDGKQRITALLDFYESRFKYQGKYFHELCARDQGHFENYSINYAETEPLTQEQKLRYFLKLNTTGVPVDPAHINKVKEMWDDIRKK